ncbi:MAG: transcriptional activator NhaR [Deltaproteobacteria bacterium]|nr:transcriptional activator NhaR [Deltaproteobacteria bacterium]
MRWLNYQHLYYFWHIARCGSVTGAARQLRLAQPTISAQMKSFEHILGEKLFQRSGRSLALTESGKLAYRYAEQIFSMGQEFLDVLDGTQGSSLQEFRIGIADVVPKSLAYRLIEPALRPENGVSVHCYEDKTEKLLAELSIGEIDLVIADRPIPPNVKVKAFNHFIGECGVSFLAARSLSRKLAKNFPSSLNGAPLLMPTAEAAVRHELDRWIDENGLTPRHVAAFQDRALMKLAAKDGKGIMPVPSAVEEEVCKEFQLERVGRIPNIKEQIFLISIDRRLKNPLLQLICREGQKGLRPRKT